MPFRFARNLTLLVLVPLALVILALGSDYGRGPVLSRWGLPAAVGAAVPGGLVGKAEPLVAAFAPAAGAPSPLAPVEQLEAFNAGSTLQEDVAGGRLRFFRRALGGGELVYFVAMLDEQIHLEVLNADGATPASDKLGDTIWADRQRHLATVAEMAGAPYATRAGMDLLAAMAFSFHGAERTSSEGSVVINGVIHRVNAGRGTLCVRADHTAAIGRFDAAALAGCAQAIGGGPVILLGGKIANPAVRAAEGEFVPFNPLGEDFVQLDWRIKIYSGLYPKTAVCVGAGPAGRSFVVLANSSGITGVDLARALRDMGCHDALGGDDDTSTQATWRGQPVGQRAVREVPDALAIYVRP